MNEFMKSLLKDILIAIVLATIILFFIRPTIVKQTSMQPTFNPNDYVILYKRAYAKKMPKRGDVIVFQSKLKDEKGKDKLLIKRVIGLPEDVISVKDNNLYINGKLYSEDYLNDGITPGFVDDLKVPDGEYFVMGDNRVVSLDSRSPEVGTIKKSQIKGKAVLRLFPFNKIKRF